MSEPKNCYDSSKGCRGSPTAVREHERLRLIASYCVLTDSRSNGDGDEMGARLHELAQNLNLNIYGGRKR